jgi:hypothetical protein
MAEIEYNSSNLLYQFESESTEDIMRLLAEQCDADALWAMGVRR